MFWDFLVKIFRLVEQAAKLTPHYVVQFPEHEIVVMSHPDGFYLKSQGKFYVSRWYRSLYSGDHSFAFQWNSNKEGSEGTYRSGHSWQLHVFKSKEEAIYKAIEIEKQRDSAKRETIRRNTFVEQKVWR